MSITKVAIDVLIELKEVISQIKDEHYRKQCDTLSGSTIGQHVRHTIEFFQCLQKGLEQGSVNYDKRDRNLRIELDKLTAIEVITDLVGLLKKRQSNIELELEAVYGTNDSAVVSIPSNYFRELSYNIEHAIHHMALIKIGIKDICEYVLLHEGFGVASSTLRYQNR